MTDAHLASLPDHTLESVQSHPAPTPSEKAVARALLWLRRLARARLVVVS